MLLTLLLLHLHYLFLIITLLLGIDNIRSITAVVAAAALIRALFLPLPNRQLKNK